MAIQQTKRQSDLEKRLQLLRKQVYGKDESKKSTVYRLPSTEITEVFPSGGPRKSEVLISDVIYLRQDLLKILIFSSLAIGIQLILFTLLKNNIFKLNLF